MRNAKIVCTLGPASNDRRTIRDLADAGMSVARLNASHGSREDRADLIDRVRSVDEARDEPVAVMLDMQGPEIRTPPLPADETVLLETDSEIRFVDGDAVSSETVGLSLSIDTVEPGDRILLDDGLIETTVLECSDDEIRARVDTGGKLGSRKGVTVPGSDLDLDIVTESDRRELELAASKDVDFVAASFVRDADDVYEVNEVLEEFDADIPIVAKIERAGAVENLEAIVEAAYGVMVARGDLGVECPMEDVPMIQKRIIRTSRNAGSPVITATEMLDSMVTARRPTRAEASDVANAVIDGTDAVMLSAETAVGDHPVAVVEAMDRIVRQVEHSTEYEELLEQRVPTAGESRTDALARSARYLARDIGADAVVAATESGYTALKTAKYRPGVPVVASTQNDEIRRRLALSWGVTPLYARVSDQGADAVVQKAVQSALDAGVAESGDTVVVLCGMMTDLEGANTTNMMKVHVAAEALTTGRVVVDGCATGPVTRVPGGDLSDVPDGAILALPAEFDDEFDGDPTKIGGIVNAERGMTGYPALVAREMDVPMISDAAVSELEDGTTVTVDAERGVVYAGEIGDRTNRV
ncbi:pyruvate kinase [Natronobacterium gregoryi]|uniref:Pyruvate kinase n=2 Tax=Natronobacterium gregoryi TaxID=44930 RepID=L0ADH0_NATGS|nr:pyruvate kinase [Natronobacterium gregoryi]AFZ71901.1 pyruvate kinase [Natronobacterium gregoryi SP2]ELY62478.1 pyruvate kinase [Natronobacterium gregoryi SP2]PLK20685.1 pyruvate kinase [Natronobacterium gregoryi SP2]SFJ14418.1 pyruvate kinase [Natronobacterium gregoryi]